MPGAYETLHNSLYLEIAGQIEKALPHAFPDVDWKNSAESDWRRELYFQLSPAPQIKMGHAAFPCFPLAKKCRMAPPKIAEKLKDHLEEFLTEENERFRAEVSGPYLNFFFTPKCLGEALLSPIVSGEYFKKELTGTTPKTMVEYSQPNTHKILHVGHMRNLCLGNSLVKILRYAGFHTISVTYPGDVGTHVAKCLWYLKKNKLSPPEGGAEKGSWLGEIYAQANHQLEEEKGTDKEEQNRSELTAILKELENRSGEYYELWKETRRWSIELMEQAYNWANVSFDRWFFESEVDAPSLEFARNLFEEGKLTQDQGAIGMDLSDQNLGFCLLIKSDGTGLYATKDVELARKKFEEFGIEKSIYVVDNRQALHFKQVFEVLGRIGFPQAKNCHHLQYDVVELPEGAMSSRKGNIVPLMDLIHSMEKTITERYLEKYRGDWSEEEIQQTARQVANGAIKYGMIRIDNNRKIVFDQNEWLKLDGETGPYLQYVCARIRSLCEKQNLKKQSNIDWEKLTAPSEEALMIKLLEFNHIAVLCAENMKTLHMTSFLYELGKLFNTFYVECPIGKLENEDLKQARLHLAHSVGKIMEQGLSLLGIPVPKRM